MRNMPSRKESENIKKISTEKKDKIKSYAIFLAWNTSVNFTYIQLLYKVCTADVVVGTLGSFAGG